MATQDIAATAARLARRIAVPPPGARRSLVAVAGPPGVGKSTLAAALAGRIEGAVLVPMDGFHLDNAILKDRGLLHRKGAPETFDGAGFVHAMHRLRDEPEVILPGFDRARDIAIAGAQAVTAADRVAVVEGNYLLLRDPPWNALAPLWDLTVFLTVDMAELERRLIRRWRDHGLDPATARTRARENDLASADRVLKHSRPADVTL